MLRRIYNASGPAGRKSPLRRKAVAALVLSLAFFGVLHRAPRVAHADTQLGQRPRGVRAAHLVSDPIPGRIDYVFRERNSGSPSVITAYAPGGTLLCTIPPDPSQPIQALVDVVDLDGDGNAEIIGTYGGNGSTDFAALWIYNGNCTLRAKWNTPQATTLAPEQVKIYDVLPANGQKRIVFVPNTFPNYGGLPAPVYFIDAWGNQVAQPLVPPQNSPVPDILTFPGIAVGNIDNAGGYEIVIIAKSRLMAFNQNGQKLYYRQFVDLGGTFLNYNTANDKPAGSTSSFEGRRYGLFQFNDVNGDGDLELIVAADANNIGAIPGAVYEAYNLSASAQSDTYQPSMWQRWLPRADSNYTVTYNNPAGYPLGVPLDGIADVNGDGIPEIMLTESDAATGNPLIKAINARTGAVTGTLINGILVGARRLDNAQSLWDLIVYDNLVFNPNTSMGNIKVFRLNAGTYTPFQLPQSPSGSLSNFAADVVGTDVGDQISFSDSGYLGTGLTSGQGHFAPLVVRTGGVRTFVAYTAIGCPSGIYSWKTTGGVVQPSLTVYPRPGELVSALPTTDNKNHVWVFNLENFCTLTNVVRTAVQSGSTLVANGDL